MRPRTFSVHERRLLRKMWERPDSFPVRQICAVLGCSTKTVVREVEAMGMALRYPPDRRKRRLHPKVRCACGALLAHHAGRQCRACYEAGKPAAPWPPTPDTRFRCDYCGGRSKRREGHIPCVSRHRMRTERIAA